eukprot:3619799-Pyramimonas_sp.AAC.1
MEGTAPASTPTQGVEHASAFTMQEAYQAGTPAGGSDGSWIQAQSADLSGMTTSNGITPNDGLYVKDPWRAPAQQMPALAGQLAPFAPMSRATTPFGTQSAGSTN